MVEIIFKDGKIQKGYRVKIPKAVIDTLDIKEGQKVLIKFDPVKKRLIIEEDGK
jgi:bifunctional DNA-binding transcriptional regulator/antitoxin component of YhaV-PrlF toxin-antitoxin module